MDAATLVLLVSGVGVGFGWQPMPDGSPRYEYVVQVDPDLLATLSEGQSIPIVGEVPAHVHPIGRVRVVVGRSDLPRQQLATLLKPVAETGEASSAHGVKLAQYAAQPYPPASQPDYGAAPNAAADWNVPATADRPLAGVGEGLRDATEPLREGLGLVDDRVRTTIDNLGNRTRGVLDELGRPFSDQPTAATTPPAATTGASATAAPGWNGAVASGGAMDDGAAGNNWNESTVAGGGLAGGQLPEQRYPAAGMSAVAAGAAPRFGDNPQTRDANSWNNDATGSADNGYPPSAGQPADDPWNNASDARLRSGNGTTGLPGITPTPQDVASRPASPFGGVGGAWNNDGPRLPDPSATAITPPPSWDGGILTVPSTLGVPAIAIGKGMLAQPADQPLEGANPNERFVSSELSAPLAAAASNERPTAAGTLSAAAQGWDVRSGTANTTTAATTAPISAGDRATALVAWVLLTSSAAGNLYLFWSYLDVRQKYRSLVRKTARAVGSRFSAT